MSDNASVLREEEVANGFGGLTFLRYLSDGVFVVVYDSDGRMIGNNYLLLADGVPDDSVITLKTCNKEVEFTMEQVYGNGNQSVNHL